VQFGHLTIFDLQKPRQPKGVAVLGNRPAYREFDGLKTWLREQVIGPYGEPPCN